MAKTKKAKTVQREAPNSIRFPDELKDKIEKEAEKENRNFSNKVITICEEHFNNQTHE